MNPKDDKEFKEKLRRARLQLLSDGMIIREFAARDREQDPALWDQWLEELEKLEDDMNRHFPGEDN